MELKRSVTLITTIHHVNQEYGSEEELLFILADVHTQVKVEQNCTFWYTIGCSLAGTQISTIWYSFLQVSFCTPVFCTFKSTTMSPKWLKKYNCFILNKPHRLPTTVFRPVHTRKWHSEIHVVYLKGKLVNNMSSQLTCYPKGVKLVLIN